MATFEDVRRIALSLPETSEVLAWQDEVTFRVRNKIFVMEQERRAHASFKSTPTIQADLVERDPATFAPAAYVGRFGWVDVDLERVDEAELERHILDAWRLIAPKRLAARLPEPRG
jgi:predicted DNA-binding protein (MmcQ/YjbR family)